MEESSKTGPSSISLADLLLGLKLQSRRQAFAYSSLFQHPLSNLPRHLQTT